MKHSRTDEKDRKGSVGNGKEGTEEGLYSKKRDKTGLWIHSGVSTGTNDECDNRDLQSVDCMVCRLKRRGRSRIA